MIKKLLYRLIIRPVLDMKLKRKLLLSYFLLILFPFGIFAFLSNYKASIEVESLVKYASKQSFEQSSNLISNQIKKIIDSSNVILVDEKVNKILAQNPDSLDIYTQLKDRDDLFKLLSSYQNKEEINRVRLYVNDVFIYSSENDNFFSLQDAENTTWFKELAENGMQYIWRKPEPDKISLIRPVLDKNNYLHMIALLRIDIPESYLQEILKKTSSTKNSVTFIQNSKNEIISSSNQFIKPDWKLGNNLLKGLAKNGSYFGAYTLTNEKILLACQQISNSDWYMISITPYNEILAASNGFKNQMLILFLLIGTAAYGIAYFISFSITRRIRLLTGTMKKIQNGDFNTTIMTNSKDEIGELINDFNFMTNRVSFLVKEQFRIGQEAKNAELLALQSQINPHFLYNTLDLVNWTAINNNVPEIAETVRSLSKFYKLSLSKGANIIPIHNEIEHVKLYVDLQNRRFDDAFIFEVETEEEIYEYTTLKIILQPIVENAIIHGILEKTEKEGHIKLKGYMENDTVVFIVQDDGYGIPEDKLAGLLSADSKRDSHGYGARNINERIKLYYGEQYGLSYSSTIGIGTTVTVRIPAVKANA